MTGYSTPTQVVGLIGCLAMTFAAAAVGGLASTEAPLVYRELELPSWAPPAWVFGPVWTVLYLLQGIAIWLIWRTRDHRRGLALGIFLVQLGINAIWSWLFFAWRLGALAFADILLLDALVIVTTVLFWRIRPLAAVLLMPYLAWILFATVLAWAIWQANPALL